MIPAQGIGYKKAIVALIFCNLIWGVAGPVIKATLDNIPPYTFLFLRCAIACLIMIPLLVIEARKKIIKVELSHIPHLFLLGFIGVTINLALIFEGFKRTSSLEGTLIGSLGPLMIVAIGIAFLNEKIGTKAKIGMAVTFLGTLILILEPIRINGHIRLNGFYGNILILLSHIEWTLYVLYSKKIFNHRKHYSPLVITAFLFLTGLITFAPLALVEYFNDSSVFATALRMPNILGILYMGIFSSVIGYFLYEYALEKVDAGKTAIFGYLGPIFAAPVAILFLKETVSPLFLIASLIIVTGVIIINSRWKFCWLTKSPPLFKREFPDNQKSPPKI